MRLATAIGLGLLLVLSAGAAMAQKDEGDPRLPVDYDYYQINLTAGVQVIIELMASPVCDPDVGDTKLYLYGPNSCTTGGTGAMYNDDISYPSNNYSRITYTPTTSGVYYIKAQGYSSSYLGCYKMTIACAGVTPTTLVDEVEPNDTCGSTVQLLTCDNYVHGRIGGIVAACCNPSTGACTLTEQASCLAPSIWHPEWLACSPNPCPQPPQGACCNPTTGACTITAQASCSSPSIWHAEWTTCLPNPCPQPPRGACCTSDGHCSITTQTGCTSPSIWQGADTVCRPNPCPGGQPAPENDTCEGAIAIPCGQGVITGNINWAQNDYDPAPTPNCTGYAEVGADLVYVAYLYAGDAVSFSLMPTPTSYDAAIYVITDCADPHGSCVIGDDSGNPEAVAWTVATTGTYYIICDKWGASLGDGFTLTYSIPCPPVMGACCALDGTCTLTVETACAAPSIWHPEWIACEPENPCPQPPAEAACCFADGHCEMLTEAACLAAPDHVIWLPEESCALANPCEQPGACCNPDTGACAYVLQQFCLPPNNFLVGLTCVPTNPCPPPIPTAACCDPLGNCTVTTQAACLAPSVWHPEWPTCDPNNCPPPVPTKNSTWGQIKANYR